MVKYVFEQKKIVFKYILLQQCLQVHKYIGLNCYIMYFDNCITGNKIIEVKVNFCLKL